MSNIFLAGGLALSIIVLVCGLPMCCYDSYMKSQEQKRREEEYNKKYVYYKDKDGTQHYGTPPPPAQLPEKILKFETAMKDINTNV